MGQHELIVEVTCCSHIALYLCDSNCTLTRGADKAGSGYRLEHILLYGLYGRHFKPC